MLLSILQTEIPPRQGSFSFLTVWPADHPHPWSRGCSLAQGRAHPFPPQERGQETSVQVNDFPLFMKQKRNAQVPSQCSGRGSGGSQHDGTTRSGANSLLQHCNTLSCNTIFTLAQLRFPICCFYPPPAPAHADDSGAARVHGN